MKNISPKPVYLKDYKKPTHLIKEVDLTFDLEEENTRVRSAMQVVQNGEGRQPLVLNGEELEFLSVSVDGVPLRKGEYLLNEKSLTIQECPSQCLVEVENRINPKNNTALDGLYLSGNIFCTQNEPQGFRRITYFLDRSDVMAKFRVTIIADKEKCPVLLSNGNEVKRSELSENKHSVTWEDPFPKPSYLFALVAGDLGMIRDQYVTGSGRNIDLRIYCDKGNEYKCDFAMGALKRSMRWDEEVFGLEYDLDIYMIVAVDAFNMGAMENKGLNIFNTACVLADPKSETDQNFMRVEGVIAHEYFHNWTGNRVTCRDWFQLTLKEGLTVFRDQEYTSDHFSRPVKRIEDVQILRSYQFSEDAGPMAHPIKPQSYLQINNFYTTTVYNKGAEVIRMIETLIGKETFRKGIDKYFELFDGQAVTTEDFLHAMELASGRDLSQFKRWYSQAGTPEINVSGNYDPQSKKFSLTVEQFCKVTADKSSKEPFYFPLSIGLLGQGGKELYEEKKFVEVSEANQTFLFEDIEEQPVLSINRNFSAPIKVNYPYSQDEYQFLMAHDKDPFNRWDAGQQLAKWLLLDLVEKKNKGEILSIEEGYFQAYEAVLEDQILDRALKAEALLLPTEATLAEEMEVIDFDAIHFVREFVANALAKQFQPKFLSLYNSLKEGEYRLEPKAMHKRQLKNVCLHYLSRIEDQSRLTLLKQQYSEADNMTDQFAALTAFANIDCSERQEVLRDFYVQWKEDPLVMNKWFAVQAGSKLDNTLQCVEKLCLDPLFDWMLPNVVRAVVGTFVRNLFQFHKISGEGYHFIADVILNLDAKNPQVAARLAGGFEKFAKLDPFRKEAMQKELTRILDAKELSTNVYEVISKTLESGKELIPN